MRTEWRIAKALRTGLVLQTSRTNPRVRRWMRMFRLQPGAPDGARPEEARAPLRETIPARAREARTTRQEQPRRTTTTPQEQTKAPTVRQLRRRAETQYPMIATIAANMEALHTQKSSILTELLAKGRKIDNARFAATIPERVTALSLEQAAVQVEIAKVQDKYADKCRGLLTVANPAKVAFRPKAGYDAVQEQTTLEALLGMIDASMIRPGAAVNVSLTQEHRCSFQLGTIKMSDSTLCRQRAFAHEMGHWLEEHNSWIKNRAHKFFEERTKGETAVPLGPGYDPDEVAYRDRFIDHYMGKHYKAGDTEIISMGLEYLYSNPLALYRSDPEYFGFMLDILGITGAPGRETPEPEGQTAQRQEADYLGKHIDKFHGTVACVESTTLRSVLQRMGKLFGQQMTAEDVAKLLGAHGGETVTLQWPPGRNSTFYASIDGPDYNALLRVDGKEIHVVEFQVNTPKTGATAVAKFIAQQVAQGHKFGATLLTMLSEGGPQDREHIGYDTLARVGFDAPLDAPKPLPRFLAHARTVSDILRTPKGPEWWKRNGWGFQGEFDLSPDSVNRKILAEYLRANGL